MPLDKIQSQPDLDRTLAALDAVLFDSYNHCDLQKFASFFVDDVEFYHDQGGVTLGRTALTDSVKQNICGKTTRELVSMQVFYMIRIRRAGNRGSSFPSSRARRYRGVGEGKFIHLWQYKDEAWKITRRQLRPPRSSQMTVCGHSRVSERALA